MDGSIVERRPLRFERTAAASPKVQAVRQLDADEIAGLIRRGEAFLANRDIAAARLVLQRAAEAGSARAALALAGTFDPNVLGPLEVRGVVADVALALIWYEKAKDFGSAEAPRRLERLASRDQ
jgi:TPR repeat protein